MKSKVSNALTDKGLTTHATQVEDMCICSKSLDGESKKENREIKETEQNRQERKVSSSCYLDHLASNFLFFFCYSYRQIDLNSDHGCDRWYQRLVFLDVVNWAATPFWCGDKQSVTDSFSLDLCITQQSVDLWFVLHSSAFLHSSNSVSAIVSA